MKFLYATSLDLPSTRANRIQIMSMAGAFSGLLGKDFVLGLDTVAPNTSVASFVKQMHETRSYILALRYLSFAKKEKITHIYCREERLLCFLLFYNRFIYRLPITFSYELHHLLYIDRFPYNLFLRSIAHVVSITEQMKQVLISRGFIADTILVAPDAVDITQFSIPISKEDARIQLNLPQDARIILYTGTIDEPWKGADLLYTAATQLDDTYQFVIVGGKPHYVEEVGYRPHQEIPVYMKAADVLVLPNSAKAEISRIGTSPMKLFEYMAAERPIVASDLPSIREVLDEHMAIFVSPDNAQALAGGIVHALQDSPGNESRVRAARKAVERYTWDQRADAIVSFIEDHA
jgi:glycosyltransferase involved in cell wall biosynthesis